MHYLDRADETYEEMRDEGWRWGEPRTKSVPMNKYKANLRVEREYIQGKNYIQVYSYDTHVASGIEGDALSQRQYFSRTTSKHVNYVAKELNMKVVKDY